MAVETPTPDDQATPAAAADTGWQQLYRTEDWWAVWIGGALLAICTCLVWLEMASGEKGGEWLQTWLGKPGSWKTDPLDAFTIKGTNIKTGLVLLGAEIVVGRLLALGLPGVFVSWVVTPIVLIGTFWFGQRILRMASPTLNIVISAAMSVCGVSAAIATAAACKAKRSELSLAIGLSLSFTVIMMVVMPMAIRASGMSNVLGGAWLGGRLIRRGPSPRRARCWARTPWPSPRRSR